MEKNEVEFLTQLPFYLAPVFIILYKFFSTKIRNTHIYRSYKTDCMKDLWKIFLNFDIDGQTRLGDWKAKNAYFLNEYFQRGRDKQVRDLFFLDANLFLKSIARFKNRKKKERAIPIIILLDEIVEGRIMSHDQIVTKYIDRKQVPE